MIQVNPVKTLLRFIILMIQASVTFAVLLAVYLVFSIDDQDDFSFMSMMAAMVFQPVMGITLVLITILAAFILGLPLRLHKGLYKWWTNHQYIPMAGSIIAGCMLIASLIPALKENVSVEIDGEQVVKKVPHMMLSAGGWYLLAFSLMHFFPKSLFSFRRRIK